MAAPEHSSKFEITDQNFLCALRVLDDLRIPYWVNCGSLLGLVRQGSLIEWDADIDISMQVGEGRLGEIYQRLAFLGFSGGRSFRPRPSPPSLKLRRPGGRDLDFTEFELQHWTAGDLLVRRWYRRGGHKKNYGSGFVDRLHRVRMVLTHGPNPPSPEGPSISKVRGLVVRHLAVTEATARKILKLPTETVGMFIQASDVFPTESRSDVRGAVVQFPKNPLKVLNQLYGRSWTKPVQSDDWSAWLISEPRNEKLY